MAYNRFKIFCFITIALFAFIIKNRFSFRAHTILNFQLETCPFCFGKSFCDRVNILYVEVNLIDFIFSVFNHKYVIYGSLGDKPVVIKHLARRQEIVSLEFKIALISNFNEYDFHNESLQLLNSSFNDPSYKSKLCPTVENAHLLFTPVFEDFNFVNIWTALQLNPEPLFLQILNKREGWPVPEYIGSCGRIMVVEWCGKTVDNYLNRPSLFRLHIMEELLRMAYNFTFSHPNFSFYFRDISYSNIVLDSDLKTRIVDLEHVIVVSKNVTKEDQPVSWHQEHESEDFYCEDCMIYSPHKICSCHISDHNFYAICKEFLHTIYPKDLGLLHSLSDVEFTPSVVEKLRYYATECIHPSRNDTRFKIAKEFMKLLSELKVLKEFSADTWKEML